MSMEGGEANQRKQDKEFKLRVQLLELQKARLIKRFEAKQRRDVFIKKNLDKILSLPMDGWPRTKNMKSYIKWLDLIFDAKIKGIYGVGTANCDVIAQLNRHAKEMKGA